MSHRRTSDSAELARLLVSAAGQLADPSDSRVPVPVGVPVREGRLALGRLRPLVQVRAGDAVACSVGFELACWLGSDPSAAPRLGRLWHQERLAVDGRGRVRLGRRVRAYLAVDDPAAFEVVPVPVDGGVLLVPVEGFERRWEAVAACAA